MLKLHIIPASKPSSVTSNVLMLDCQLVQALTLCVKSDWKTKPFLYCIKPHHTLTPCGHLVKNS